MGSLVYQRSDVSVECRHTYKFGIRVGICDNEYIARESVYKE